MNKRFLCVLLSAVLSLFPVMAAASEPAKVSVKDVNESIFRIATTDADGTVIPLGTGFAIGESAPVSYVATSNHVIEKYKDNIMVWMNRDHFVKCSVVISLSEVDVAVLKLEKAINKPPLPLGESRGVSQGDQIYIFGFPDYDIADRNTAYSGDVTATMGAISKKTKLSDIEYYQVDAAVNNGNSGGPLFHAGTGLVIGIITIKSLISDGINGAVYIEKLIEALDLESIPYITLSDFQPQGAETDAPEGTDRQGGDLTLMLLRIGIGLAVLAIILLAVALYLRGKDRKGAGFDGEEEYMSPPADNFRREEIPPERPQYPRGGSFPKNPTIAIPEGKTKLVDPASRSLISGGKLPVLRAAGGFFAGGVVPVGAQVIVGRDASSCQLVYPMDMTNISRNHVRITYSEQAGAFYVTDLSTNGTFLLSGTRLEKNKPVALDPGAQFYLSDKTEIFTLDLEDM